MAKRHFRALAACAFGLAASLAAPAAAQTTDYKGRDDVIGFAEGDAAMNAAIARGRTSVSMFFERWAAPQPGDTDFHLKFDLIPGTAAEYIWAAPVERTGHVTIGVLLNDPVDPRWKRGDRVTIADRDIVDWVYFRGGVAQGGFTIRVMLDAMDSETAATYRRAYGW